MKKRIERFTSLFFLLFISGYLFSQAQLGNSLYGEFANDEQVYPLLFQLMAEDCLWCF